MRRIKSFMLTEENIRALEQLRELLSRQRGSKPSLSDVVNEAIALYFKHCTGKVERAK